MKPRIKKIPPVTLADEPVDVAVVVCSWALAVPAAILLIILFAEISSSSERVVVALSVVFVLMYLTNNVSGSPVAESATATLTTSAVTPDVAPVMTAPTYSLR